MLEFSGAPTYYIYTHNGRFHRDEIMACALAVLYLESINPNYKIKIMRTRQNLPLISWFYSQKFLQHRAMMIDVGRHYDPENWLFDHHQESFQECRKNGHPYAAVGLVWKEFGKKIISNLYPKSTKKQIELIFSRIDSEIIEPADQGDYGKKNINRTINSMGPLLRELQPIDGHESGDQEFYQLMKLFISFFKKIIARQFTIESEVFSIIDEEIIVLNETFDWKKVVNEHWEKFLHINLMVYSVGNQWLIESLPVRRKDNNNEARLGIPKKWRNKTKEELQKKTGLNDIIYCKHNIAATLTKESAIKFATNWIECESAKLCFPEV